MFVEQLSWLVPRDQAQSASQMLDATVHHMEGSGGFIRSFAGCETTNARHFLSLNFWKSWEDLSRFLGSKRAAFLSDYGKLSLHHYEVIWEWPGDEVNRSRRDGLWALHDFTISSNLDQLLATVRHEIPMYKSNPAFRDAGMWLDKNNPDHIVLAIQWTRSMDESEALKLPANWVAVAGVNHNPSVFALHVAGHPDLLKA
jgi:hypothetical protein